MATQPVRLPASLQAIVPGEVTVANQQVCVDVIGGKASLECQVCKYVLDQPMLLSCCGQYLCAKCVTAIQHSNMTGPKRCPFCKEPNFTSMLNKGLLREINELKVRCPNAASGCAWEGQLNQVVQHTASRSGAEGECRYQRVQCRSSRCRESLLRVELHDHETQQCEYRQFTCKHCLNFTNTYQIVISQHYPVCSEFPVPCPNKCEVADMSRSALEEHLSVCPLQVVACDYQSAGCNCSRPRKSLSAHYATAANYHNQLLVRQNASLQSKVEELERGLPQQLSEQRGRFEQLLHDQELRHKNQMSLLERRLADNSLALQRLETRVNGGPGSVQEALLHTENKFAQENKVMRNELNAISPQLYSLLGRDDATKKRVDEMASRCEAIQQHVSDLSVEITAVKTEHPNTPALVVQHIAPTLDAIEDLREKVKACDGQVTTVREDLRYVEQSLTPQPPFAFTVSRFSDRKFNKEPFVSSAFYSHLRGYKLCVRVDVHGVHNELAVYCCLMKGEHDNTLVWPFQGNVHLRIQNQLGNHAHYEKMISYDEGTADNKRGRVTTGDKSYLHGFQRFISHEELALDRDRNCQYLKGDAVDFEVIKVEVKSLWNAMNS